MHLKHERIYMITSLVIMLGFSKNQFFGEGLYGTKREA